MEVEGLLQAQSLVGGGQCDSINTTFPAFDSALIKIIKRFIGPSNPSFNILFPRDVKINTLIYAINVAQINAIK